MDAVRTGDESPLRKSLRGQVERVLASLDATGESGSAQAGKVALRRFLEALDQLGTAAEAVGQGPAAAEEPARLPEVLVLSPPPGLAEDLRQRLDGRCEVVEADAAGLAGDRPTPDIVVAWEPHAAAAVEALRQVRPELPAIVVAPEAGVPNLLRAFGERPAIVLQELVSPQALVLAVRSLLALRQASGDAFPAGPPFPDFEARSYAHMVGLLPRSLERAIEFDVGAGVLARPAAEPLVDVHSTSAVPADVLDRVREVALGLFRLVAGGVHGSATGFVLTPPPVRSSLHAPLATGGRVVGLTYLGSFRQDAFTAKDERVLTSLAANASGAYGRLDGSVRHLRLTPRQSQILALIAAGMSDREVGERLGLAHRTVRTHLDRLLREHGLRSRTEAVAAWLRGQQE